MTTEVAVFTKWLDVVSADGIQLKSLVTQLPDPYELKALIPCKDSMQGLGLLFRDVYAVLEQLQQHTHQANGLVTSELGELLRDFVSMAFRLREFIKRFSEEQPLCQFVRSQKVVECMRECRDGVEEFVYGVEQSHIFQQVAASSSIGFGVLNQNQAHWWEQVEEITQGLESEINALDPATICVDEKEKAVSTLKFEIQRARRRGAPSPHLNALETQLSDLMTKVMLVPWLIPSDDITLGIEIGRGGFGVVHLGKLGSKTRVVVKRTIKNFDKKAMLREISIWYQLKHPHILQFIGATYLDSTCSLVSEFAQHGQLGRYWVNLDGSIDSNRKKQLWRFFYEAALGLHYMHGQGFVHGDLKCDNILIGEDLKAKLVDFGLSFKNGDHQNVLCSAAVHWAAPECLDKTRTTERSFSTDVYMFGMCIVEALIGGPPYDGSPDPAICRFVKQGELPISIGTLAPQVQELVRAMCAFDPSARMELEDVIAKLKEFVDAADPSLLVVSE